MRFMLKDRGRGKTTHALRWVARGQRINGYPGWSRVLIVSTVSEEMRLRTTECPDRPGESWWKVIEDWSHRVYSLKDWSQGRNVRQDTEVAIDEIEWCLYEDPLALRKVLTNCRVVAGSMTMRGVWEDEEPL